MVSLHEHATVAPANVAEMTEYRRQGREWTGYVVLSVSGLDCVFDALMGGTETITSRAGWKWGDVVYDLGMRMSDVAHSTFVVQARSLDDIRLAKASGRIALVPCLETATPIENELDRIDVLYGLGVRSVGIAYSEANPLGSGLREERDAGLTEFGRLAVRRMNRDRHLARRGPDLARHDRTERAPGVRHACRRAGTLEHQAHEAGRDPARLRRTRRRHRDLRRGAHHAHREASAPLARVGDGALRVRRATGRDRPRRVRAGHVLRRARRAAPLFAARFSVAASRGGLEVQEVEYVDGIENPGESFPNVVRWLVAHGYADEDVGKVIGGNVLRTLGAIWG